MMLYTNDKKHAVQIIGEEGNYKAIAEMCDGQEYGGNSYWFSVGNFGTLRGAKRSAVRQMKALGYNLIVD